MCRLLVAIEFVIVMVIKAGREVGCSSVVECVLILSVGHHPSWWVVELPLVPASASQLVKQKPWYVMSCYRMVHIKQE